MGFRYVNEQDPDFQRQKRKEQNDEYDSFLKRLLSRGNKRDQPNTEEVKDEQKPNA